MYRAVSLAMQGRLHKCNICLGLRLGFKGLGFEGLGFGVLGCGFWVLGMGLEEQIISLELNLWSKICEKAHTTIIIDAGSTKH